MKKYFIIIKILLLPLLLNGQSNEQFYKQFSEAVNSGSAASLSQLLHEEVDYQFRGKDERFSRTETENRLHQFFSTSIPLRFYFKHQGGSADGQLFGIGQLETAGGKYYRIMCRAKAVGTSYRIIRLDIGE